MANTINCKIAEEKINVKINNDPTIHVKVTGGGVIENIATIISQYKIMLKTVYDIDEDGIVDYAEALKSGSNILTYLSLKNTVDLAHSHANKTTLDSLVYDGDYGCYLITG